MLFNRLNIFTKLTFTKKYFQEYHQSVIEFGSRSGLMFVMPDLGPKGLKRLSADSTNRQRVN